MAKIDKEEFRALLQEMDFYLVNGEHNEIWEKVYENHDNYTIRVNFDDEKGGTIDYITGASATQSIAMRSRDSNGTPSKSTRKTTSNFSQQENMVVLECINRLLDIGYKPNDLTIEKSWKDENSNAYLDVYVEENNKAYLMVECKTPKTYGKEKAKMLEQSKDFQPKAKLWSYADKEKSDIKLLCLYVSKLGDEGIERDSSIIEFKDEWRNLNSRGQQEAWLEETRGKFKDSGIFETGSPLYNKECYNKRKIVDLTEESAAELFQSFLEILRHNAISDKVNAFNKLLNIFMCKIVDEDRPENQRQFWWGEDTKATEFMSVLEDLYKKGMKEFLNKQVTDYTNEDINNMLPGRLTEKEKAEIREAFRKQKTERSSEFAFREIYNEFTFNQNALIVKEIVEEIQKYRFRYGKKHQFLGDFFEELLATSIKQEAGQFFTPIRIARFICSSLPLQEETIRSLNDDTVYNLPLVIDYACGSGHFLTEYMDLEQGIIDTIDRSKYSQTIRRELGNVQDRDTDYNWAEKYVYGIEKDYRLAKTTKLNTFLNGDGQARIINEDGLLPFSKYDSGSALYSENNNNGQFTFLIANPPYSVKNFVLTMNRKDSSQSFELWQDDMGDNIECLFLERASQLLKVGGFAGVIIPDNISYTGGVFFDNTRKLIFEKFRIKSIVNLTGKCFAKTDMTTKIMFMKRRPEKEAREAKQAVEAFFDTFKDFNFDGERHVIQRYLDEYAAGMPLDKYISFVSKCIFFKGERYIARMKDVVDIKCEVTLNQLVKSSAYEKANDKQKVELREKCLEETTRNTIISNEKEKLYYYLLTLSDNIIIADTLDKDECSEFIGLTFSERGGKQTTNTNPNNGLINDENVWDDKNKLNYYIRMACLGTTEELPKQLESHARWAKASELFSFTGEFKNTFRVNLKKKEFKNLPSGVIELRVDKLFDVPQKGNGSLTKEYCRKHPGNYRVYTGATSEETEYPPIDTFSHKGKTLTYVTDGEIGCVDILSGKYNIGGHRAEISLLDKSISLEGAAWLLRQAIKEIQRGYVTVPGISWDDLRVQYVQLPVKADGTIDYQEQYMIAQKLDLISTEIIKKKKQIDAYEQRIIVKFKDMFGDVVNNEKNWDYCRLGNRCKVVTGNTPDREESSYYGNYIEWIKSDNINTNIEFLTKAKEYLSKKGMLIGRHVDSGAVLMTCIAGSLNCIGNIAITDRMVCFNQQINAIIPGDNETWYIYYMLLTSKDRIQATANKALKNIVSKGKLEDVEYSFPPKPLQLQFARYAKKYYLKKSVLRKDIKDLKAKLEREIEKAFI